MSETYVPEGETAVYLACGIVEAYIANHHVRAEDLPGLISSVHTAVAQLTTGASSGQTEPGFTPATPAQIRKSITPSALVSFIDGKPYKTLRRHLTKYGLSPQGYRARYGLPSDYPMSSPDYSALRSSLAKNIGLGSQGGRGGWQASAK